MNLTKSSNFILEAIMFILLMWFYAGHSLLLPDPSKLYSKDIPYRLQTNAFLNGKLFLSPRPYGAIFDTLWTEHGMSQNWGLGVPLLRLPFEWSARLCGQSLFPDKLTVLFYLALMIVLLNIALRSVLNVFGIAAHSLTGLLTRWYLISWILFCPGIYELIKYKIDIYHEAIFYGYMYSCLLLALFWVHLRKPSNRNFLVLCLVSGFAILVRPTVFFYGSTTFALAAVYVYQDTRNIRLLILGILCFCLGMFVELWLNYVRFGSIFEFGYSACLTTWSPCNYFLRFNDSPFRREPLLSASKELIGALFFNNAWVSSTFRCRDTFYNSYNILYLIVLLGGGFLFVILTLYNFFRRSFFDKRKNTFLKIIYFSLSWGMICFGGLFIFYLQAPCTASRYWADFAASLSAILISLFLLGMGCLNSLGNWRKNKKYLIVFIILTGMIFFLNKNIFIFNPDRLTIDMTNKQEVQGYVSSFDQRVLLDPYFPNTFYCSRPDSPPDLVSQFAGWDISTDCLVSGSSVIFLPAEKCLTLNYSITRHEQQPPVQVKRGLAFLKLTNPQIVENDPADPSKEQITQRFCSDSFPSNTVALYTIGWVSAEKLSWDKEPIVLNWVSVSDNKITKNH